MAIPLNHGDLLQGLAAKMQRDWDRRIAHDYRFWMSDGYESDQELWSSGERDFSILLEGVDNRHEKSFLELGCGVGRLLRPALRDFAKVIGVDVADEATKKARELLGANPKLEIVLGDGFSLRPVEDASIDVAVSFAALSSMPTDVIASYLLEIHRVLKPGGVLRIQAYVGDEQKVHQDDTLHLRCFRRENVSAALNFAGFTLDWIRELILPFEVSAKKAGIEAVIISLRKGDRTGAQITEIAHTLLPQGEVRGERTLPTADLECWMAISYGYELLKKGEIERAKLALQHARTVQDEASAEIQDYLRDLETKLDDGNVSEGLPVSGDSLGQSDIIVANRNILRQRFPEAARVLSEDGAVAEVRHTEDGPVVWIDGLCLDHPTRPRDAARVWVERTLRDARVTGASKLVVFGLSAAYHLEELIRRDSRPVVVIEPDLRVARAALASRNLTALLERVSQFLVGTTLDLDSLGEGAELLVRPQAQMLHPEACAAVKSSFYGARGLAVLKPKFAVLGPLQGGTQPMTTYTARALMALEQRVRPVDMSGFGPTYHLINDTLKCDLRRSTMIGNYIELLSQLVLESLQEKPIDILICMAQAPITGRVLTELRRQGVITVLWFVEDYLRFGYWQQVAQYYDFVFTIQRGPCLDTIRKAGAGAVHYLPTACDPELHSPVALSAEERERWGSKVSFVGAGYHNRQQLFASLCELPFKIWGTEWPTCRPFDRLVQEGGRRLSPDEYVKIFSASDINLNLHSSTERDGVDPTGDFVNPRTFELAACEAFQLTDHRALLPESFDIPREMITFESRADLKEKIAWFLERPEERREIARASRMRALRDHTYTHRLKEMLRVIYSVKYDHLKNRQEESPWAGLLRRSKRHEELHGRCQRAFDRGEEPKLDALVSDIITGNGDLSETEQKLLFLHHIKSQIVRMRREESGTK